MAPTNVIELEDKGSVNQDTCNIKTVQPQVEISVGQAISCCLEQVWRIRKEVDPPVFSHIRVGSLVLHLSFECNAKKE